MSYTRSGHFKDLVEQTQALRTDLAAIQYCIRIIGGGFRVRKLESESNYSAAVEKTFAKFQQGLGINGEGGGYSYNWQLPSRERTGRRERI